MDGDNREDDRHRLLIRFPQPAPRSQSLLQGWRGLAFFRPCAPFQTVTNSGPGISYRTFSFSDLYGIWSVALSYRMGCRSYQCLAPAFSPTPVTSQSVTWWRLDSLRVSAPNLQGVSLFLRRYPDADAIWRMVYPASIP